MLFLIHGWVSKDTDRFLVGDRLTKKAEATRERILETAERHVFEKGFRGTSLSEITQALDLTKGGFFHHFGDKDELAYALLDRWARNDSEVVEGLAERAAALAEDPLQEALLFIKLLEDWLENLDEPMAGCMFASYSYEIAQFDDGMQQFIANGLNEWMNLFTPIFDRLAATRQSIEGGVKARDLTELFAAVVEGGLVLSRALSDRHYIVRCLRQFRVHLKLLYED